MNSSDFMAGINVEGDDVREFPKTVSEILKPTPVRWIRVHLLRNRSLDEEGPTGLTYLDGIDYLCKEGYNIVAPIEVGYKANIGTIPFSELDRFIENSYHESLTASKKISEVVRKHGRQLIFGIENEIDSKAWITQSLPGIEWRAGFETWVKLALDMKLKYKRLNNILKGALDADSDAKTMTNIVAEDLRVFFSNFWYNLDRYSSILKSYSLSLDDVTDEVIDWQVELKYLKDNLDINYIGVDNYANWITKYPIYGHETGTKVMEAEKLTGKPIFNTEFGYTTYRTFFEKLLSTILRTPSASEMQLQFLENSLRSIEKSPSIGTFPWVLISHPYRPANPQQESYFGLIKMDSKSQLQRSPAFDYYIEWLRRVCPSA